MPFTVYHYEDCGGPESGPEEPSEVGDETFATRDEAERWIAAQEHPRWYLIHEESA